MAGRGARKGRGIATGLALATLSALWAGAADAGDGAAADVAPPADGPVESLSKGAEKLSVARVPLVRDLAKKAGIATDPGTPADFIVNARPTGEQDYIAVGRRETEHPIKVKTPAELKALEGGFDTVKLRNDAIRSSFPPAVKAVADAAAA